MKLSLPKTLLVAFAVLAAAAHAHADNASGKIMYSRGGNIFSINGDGTEEKPLTTDGHDAVASWSPDAQQVVFVQHYPPNQYKIHHHEYADMFHSELYVMNRDGSNLHMLQQLKGEVTSLAWSPDGTTIGMTYKPKVKCDFDPGQWCDPQPNQPDAKFGFYVIAVDTPLEPKLILANAQGVKWSPDGSKILFTATPATGLALHIASADGSNDLPLKLPAEFTGATWGTWSPDGKQIAFMGKQAGESGIYVVNADGTDARPVMKDTGWGSGDDAGWACMYPSWSPDGNRLAIFCKTMPACLTASPGQGSQCSYQDFLISLNDANAQPSPLGKGGADAPLFAPR